MPTSFFLRNVDAEPLYELVRDDPEFVDAKDYIEHLWCTFHDIADDHFLSKAPKSFHQHFWEMYLACTLRSKGMELVRVGGEGLEYYVKKDGQRLWMEAIAPTAGSFPNAVPSFTSREQLTEVPVEAILLRLTGAFRCKMNAYYKAVRKGIVLPNEQFVLAINARAIRDWPLHTEMPLFVKALLPIGQQVFHINAGETSVAPPTHLRREQIATAAGSLVSTAGLLCDEAIPLAAVLHSEVDPLNCPTLLGNDFDALLNPRASPPLPTDYFAWARRYYLNSGRIHVAPPCEA